MLLCHRHPNREWFPDVWDLPGGHVLPGETPAAALVRELTEELGVTISPPARQPFRTLSYEDGDIELAIWVVDYGGTVENRAPEEHDELRWVTAADLPELRLAGPEYGALLLEALDRS